MGEARHLLLEGAAAVGGGVEVGEVEELAGGGDPLGGVFAGREQLGPDRARVVARAQARAEDRRLGLLPLTVA